MIPELRFLYYIYLNETKLGKWDYQTANISI